MTIMIKVINGIYLKRSWGQYQSIPTLKYFYGYTMQYNITFHTIYSDQSYIKQTRKS